MEKCRMFGLCDATKTGKCWNCCNVVDSYDGGATGDRTHLRGYAFAIWKRLRVFATRRWCHRQAHGA
jgi:predicted acyltransferase